MIPLVLVLWSASVAGAQDDATKKAPPADAAADPTPTPQDPPEAAQPAVEQPPAHPDAEKFSESMRSTDPEEWIRGLARLSAHFGDGAPGWVAPLLRTYLTGEEAAQNATRTRKLLADPVIQTRVPCQDLLLYLLQGQVATPFQADVEEALSRIASDPQRRTELLQRLATVADDPAADPAASRPGATLLRRLFRILAAHDPSATVDLAMRRLDTENEPLAGDIVAALRELFHFPNEDPAWWLQWWSANRHRPMPEYLRERERDEVMAEVVEFLKRSLEPLRSQPQEFREAVLDMLDRTPEFQRLAIQEIPRLVEGASVADLTPFAERLLVLSNDAAPSSRASDPQLQLAALAALRNLPPTGFQDFEPLVVALRLRIDAIPVVTPDNGDSAALRLGRTALEVAGALGACVPRAIEEAIIRQLDAGSAAGTWPAERDELITTLLRELARVGARPESLPLIERLFASERLAGSDRAAARLRVHELAVQVVGSKPDFLGPTPEQRQRVAAFLERALQPSDADQVQFWAIAGLANLKDEAGIAPLAEVVQRSGGANRVEAAAAIFRIGGLPAVQQLRQLYEGLTQEGDQSLRADIFQHLVTLCLQGDDELASLEEFMLPRAAGAEGVRPPWFEECLADDELMKRLDPEQLPELLESSQLFGRWIRIRGEISDVMAARALAAQDEASLLPAYSAVRAATGVVLKRVDPESDRFKEIDPNLIHALRRNQLLGRRAELLEFLAANAYADSAKVLREVLDQETALRELNPDADDPRPGHLQWFLERLATREDLPGEFVQGLGELPGALKFTLSDGAQKLLDGLTQKGDGVVESRTETDRPSSDTGDSPEGSRP
ncbi:MAG: hypothetical protein AAF581_05840 [Planctomycetota bacterium]